jgi:hypothetical protein
MMRSWGYVAIVAMAAAATACSMMKKPAGGDAGEDGSPAAAVAPSAEAGPVLAANESEITRYPDEKAVDRAPVTTETGGNMRTQAGSGGELVVILKRATEVDKVAERGGYYLVIADDPKDPSRKLMGWVAEAAFGAEPERRHEPEPKVDAGGATPSKPVPVVPSKRLDVKKNKEGACPSGYAACAAICRATCKTVADCGDSAAHCTAGFCLGPGAQPCK